MGIKIFFIPILLDARLTKWDTAFLKPQNLH